MMGNVAGRLHGVGAAAQAVLKCMGGGSLFEEANCFMKRKEYSVYFRVRAACKNNRRVAGDA